MIKDIGIKTISLYALFFITLVFILDNFFFPEILSAQNFLHWDAEHYFWIKNNGYADFRVAFFPLFPMLWKFSHLGIYGIVVLNASIFLVSFYFLQKMLNSSPLETLLYLSIPSFCFFFLPYTESVFFASSTFLLIGLKQKRKWLIWLGLFLSSLSRPAFTIFIPALIICELLCEPLNKKMLSRLTSYIFISLVGLLLVGIVQHHYTGIWFNFFEVQQGWGNKLQLPNFPLTSWAGGLIVRLDGAAMLFGTIAGIILCIYIFKSKIAQKFTLTKDIAFSLAYLAGITLSVFFFRGGSLFSLNRFVFATPFIIVALHFYFTSQFIFSKNQMLVAFLLLLIFWLSFGSYVHIQTFLKFLSLSFYLFLLILIKSNKIVIHKISFILLIAANVVFQFTFLIRFLSGGWVG